MKHKIIIAGLILSSLLPISCQEDFLEAPAKSTIEPELLFSTVGLAKGAVDGIKIPFAETNSYRGRFLPYSGLNSDIEWNNASQTNGDKADLNVYDAKPINSEMNSTNNAWAKMFEGIERANICINGIRLYGNVETNPDMAQLLGEALTLRAIYYADILKTWGDVPYRFMPIETSTIYIPKTDRDVIYKQLIADLGEASTLVAWPRETAATADVEHVNKAFVKAFRARLAMVASGFQQYPDGVRRSNDPDLSVAKMYKLALDECRSIIASGTARLEPSFEGFWKKYNQEDIAAGGESLWEIPFADGRGRMLFTFAVRHNSNNQFHANGANRGGTAGPLPFVFYDYDQEDTRREVTCVPYKWAAAKDNIATQELNDLDTWYFGKYRYEWMTRRVTSTNDDGINKIYMRYAEVLLIAAEAANELEGPAAAANYLKEIRRRAFTPADHATKVDTYVNRLTTKEAMLEAIQDENKFEFTGEMERKFALIRWNLLKVNMDEAKVKMANLKARVGEYADVPTTLYFKYVKDVENVSKYEGKDNTTILQIYGLNRGEITNPGVDYTAKTWEKLDDTKINSLYKPGVNPDNRQFWPIWQVFIDGSNGQLKNDYGYGDIN